MKPTSETKNPGSVTVELLAASVLHRDAAFHQLRVAYLAHIDRQFTRLTDAFESLKADPTRLDLLHYLHTEAHRIAGTAGCYGFEALSKAAGSMETEIRVQMDKHNHAVVPAGLRVISWGLEDLRGAWEQYSSLHDDDAVADLDRREADKPVITIGDGEVARLSANLETQGYQVRHFDTPEDFLDQGTIDDPVAIIHRLDMKLSATGESFHNHLRNERILPETPFLAVLQSDHISDRIDAIHAGAAGIFMEPLTVEPFAPYLAPPSGSTAQDEPTQVMVIEDDVYLQKIVQHTLRPLHCSVVSSSGSDDIITTLTRSRPDLILLDTRLPDIDGYDIYKMLQIDPLLQSVPVILMPSIGDEMERLRTWDLGGEDYIVKPFDVQVLRRRVRKEMTRLRSKQRFASLDGLTGLHNRSYFEELVRRETRRSERYRTDFSVVLLDINDFSGVNAKFGDEVGDRILREIGGLLREAVRTSDLVSRIGGDEFGLLVLGIEYAQVQHLAQRLRDVLASLALPDMNIHSIGLSVTMVVYSFNEHFVQNSDVFRESYKLLRGSGAQSGGILTPKR